MMIKLRLFLLCLCILPLTMSCGGSSNSQSSGPPPPPPSYTFKVIHSFTGGSDGCCPADALLLDGAGNLYGTGVGGNQAGLGTVFKIDNSGNETVLLNFTGNGQLSGISPTGSLVQDSSGNLYGTTFLGGSYAYGTVFALPLNGQGIDLHSFSGWLTGDGGSPHAGLVRDGNGNMYGVTNQGGTNKACGFSCGTLYQIQPDGQETVLYNFGGYTGDVSGPYAALLLVGGTLYGTGGGGTSGNGAVFSFDLASGTESVIYSFLGGTDGSFPVGTLAQDAAGNLYGTTQSGGSSENAGTLFKLNPLTSVESVLYAFQLSATDGGVPIGGVVLDASGNLYGTTQRAGSNNCGTVYKLSSAGQLTTIYAFNCATDGSDPTASLVMDTQGNLFGTTTTGGPNNFGSVFKLTPP
jgi:uncharacterized repeat protein (TIGR03803 family)